MDLLFLHGKYEEILNVYVAYTVERKREASSTLRAMVIAACYKLVSGPLNLNSMDSKYMYLNIFV